MEINEEDLSKRLLELEYIRRELENYVNAINALQATQESLTKSLLGLADIGSKAKEIMVPYAPDIFLKGNLTDSESALVNIGTNVFKEMSMKNLKAKLENDLSEVSENIEQIAKLIQKLQEEGSRLENEANKMYEQYKSGLK